MAFTRDELIAAIEAARPAPEETPDSITTKELADSLGVGVETARRLIREAIQEGSLEPVKVARVDMSGRLNRISGYMLVESA